MTHNTSRAAQTEASAEEAVEKKGEEVEQRARGGGAAGGISLAKSTRIIRNNKVVKLVAFCNKTNSAVT